MITPSKSKPGPRGFALVVTLSLMILLTVIAVGLLSLSSISLRASSSGNAQATARANARMAMMLAIGDLQKTAGRDQAVTGPANLKQTAPIPNPAWTGVWKSDDPNSQPTWLVSGQNPNPTTALTATNSALLSQRAAAAEPGSAADTELRAEWVTMDLRNKGRFAYWVGDEGTKAKVDITRPPGTGANERERFVRAQSPQEGGLSKLNKDLFAGFEPGGSVNKQSLATLGTVALAATEAGGVTRKELPRFYMHDLTAGGYGLPVNVRNGGMKTDLSLVFDRSQQAENFVGKFLGAKPVKSNLQSAKLNRFPNIQDPSRFYLSDQIRDNVATGTGPNWGTLYNYARLWENVSTNEAATLGVEPPLESDMVQTIWGPYTNHGNKASLASDTQHTSSGISPVMSVIQMGFYLGARGPIPVTLADGTTENRYQAELHIKPIVGMWNPYNVKIKANRYRVDWAMLPYLRFGFQKPVGNTFPLNTGFVSEMWMRDYWLNKRTGSEIPTDGGQGGSYVQLETDPVDFQPGEFRLFSVGGNGNISGTNKLVPTLDINGTFKIDILNSRNRGTEPLDQKGKPLLIPAGYYGWFGDVYLQDTHWDGAVASNGGSSGTRAHIQDKYGSALDPNASHSWLTLKSLGSGGDNQLQRFTNLWNGGKDNTATAPYMPEPIVSARANVNTGANSDKLASPMESLVNSRSHIGTWRFLVRNTTEVQDATQRARGWIDTNPRVAAANLRFDGSKSVDATKREGWNAVSNLIGGAHKTGKPKGIVGDGAGGDRGLVAEGANGIIIPQGNPTPGRWQGYGGAGSTSVGGETHSIVYDVPRSPLTSVGQFQHAQLSRYNYEPGFVVGNSYANPRIPLGATVVPNFAGQGFEIADISHETNRRLWDEVFFSTLAPDYKTTSSSPGKYDSVFNFKSLVSDKIILSNPRMRFSPQGGDLSLEKIIKDAGDKAPQALASRILIDGGFNVNSTSKAAWKAILSTMGGAELPTVNPTATATSWSRPDGIRFNRFGSTINADAYAAGDGNSPAFWQGWRNLSETELDKLAEEIVVEVKGRGPFRSFADFVNRDPNSQRIAYQRKGALQAALDRVVNTPAAIPTDIALAASNPNGTQFSKPVSGENQAVGGASYLLQGDVLQSLAPILQVRSDYFRIRTSGEALDAAGKVIATAVCEAFVQRVPEYLDPADKPEIAANDLTSFVNRTFGRRFQLVSFRWLSSSEI